MNSIEKNDKRRGKRGSWVRFLPPSLSASPDECKEQSIFDFLCSMHLSKLQLSSLTNRKAPLPNWRGGSFTNKLIKLLRDTCEGNQQKKARDLCYQILEKCTEFEHRTNQIRAQ